jgi:hypothetical protein
VLPADLKLYAGGEDNFCHRVVRTSAPGQFGEMGTLDRGDIAAHKVTTTKFGNTTPNTTCPGGGAGPCTV